VILPGGELSGNAAGRDRRAEYSEPSSDMSMGFQDVAKNYYLPGIHQPSGFMEILVNKSKWDPLPADLKAIIEYACMATKPGGMGHKIAEFERPGNASDQT